MWWVIARSECSTKDKTEKGYVLESPGLRRNEPERCLSPACVGLARALLHSSLLLGIQADKRVSHHHHCAVRSLQPSLGGDVPVSLTEENLLHLPGDSRLDERATGGRGRVLLGPPSERRGVPGGSTRQEHGGRRVDCPSVSTAPEQ